MSGKNRFEEFGRTARGNTEFYPSGEMTDEPGWQGESDQPRPESWLVNLQVIEVVGVGAGAVALVSSLLPLFYR